MPSLQVIQGQNRGNIYLLDPQTNILGRDPKCQVVLYDRSASRQHTKIECHEKGKCFLEDLGSMNGTFLNGIPLTSGLCELEDRDLIAIGNTELLFFKKEPREQAETELLNEDMIFPSIHSKDLMLLGEDSKMKEMILLLFKAAPQDIPVLITGESGTGKELIAHSIHRNSRRRKALFHAINCATLDSLAESELFGHEKGAFTGAVARRQGIFELANGGTLFLDEIGDTPLPVQAKLLRVLENGTFYRVGGTALIHADVRLIAATNQDLKQKIKEKTFREDLYYRLQGLEILVPPLRQRKTDIKLLAEHFLKTLNTNLGQTIKAFTPEALSLLESYSFPGNVRELKNLIERLLILRNRKEDTLIQAQDLAPYLQTNSLSSRASATPVTSSNWADFSGTLEEFEKIYILNTFEKTNYNKSETARLLGIDRATLYSKLKKFQAEEKK
ncbi:MAG: sigma 54-interacting transcriptional regulator [Planctomycetota bacterium]